MGRRKESGRRGMDEGRGWKEEEGEGHQRLVFTSEATRKAGLEVFEENFNDASIHKDGQGRYRSLGYVCPKSFEMLWIMAPGSSDKLRNGCLETVYRWRLS